MARHAMVLAAAGLFGLVALGLAQGPPLRLG